MPANTKLNSREFVCIDKRIGYLALLIIPAVILIVISSMVNSQKMTQNSRASESNVAIVVPTKSPQYTNAIIEVCKNSALEYKFRPEITAEVRAAAAGTCVEDLEIFIKRNGGAWPGPEISPINNVSAGFQAADSVVKAWEKNGYIFEWQQVEARSVVMGNLKTQREKLSPAPKFLR